MIVIYSGCRRSACVHWQFKHPISHNWTLRILFSICWQGNCPLQPNELGKRFIITPLRIQAKSMLHFGIVKKHRSCSENDGVCKPMQSTGQEKASPYNHTTRTVCSNINISCDTESNAKLHLTFYKDSTSMTMFHNTGYLHDLMIKIKLLYFKKTPSNFIQFL